MKKIIVLLLCTAVLAGMFSGCGSAPAPDDGLKIVTTVFPLYDWVRQLTKDMSTPPQLTMLLDTGVDLHSYQPSVEDMVAISDCDLFVYVGGSSDEWVEAALEQAVNKDMVTVNLFAVLGMEMHEEHEEHDHEHEQDEHIWLSVKKAARCCEAIAKALSQVDEANATGYQTALQTYTEELRQLDDGYRAAVETASFDTLVFADRFPFAYLLEDYGLNHYAAFSGCSGETEASFETVAFLAQKLDELALPWVVCIEGSDQSVANTVIKSTSRGDQQTLLMNSMQGTTAAHVEAGVSYADIMMQNLQVLKKALNVREG